MASLYTIPIGELKGIGKSRSALFARLGIQSAGQLLEYYPRTYEDWSSATPVSQIKDGETVCIHATVGTPVNTSRVKGGRLLSKLMVFDESGSMQLVYFNNKYISSMLEYGKTYYFYGKASRSLTGLQMIAPAFAKSADGGGMHPVYRQTEGLTNRIIASAVKQALAMLPRQINDPLPQALLSAFSLCDYRFALENIHFPKTADDLSKARKRLVCQELLILNLGMRSLKNQKRGETALKLTKTYTREFEALLPYALTGAQKKAISECIQDMQNHRYPMNRLLQGDVGSGKTAVAAAVCYNAVQNGWQAAFMAPTEILAEQHYKSLSRLFSGTGIRMDILTGALTPAQKRKVREKLKNGETRLVIGTHALLTDKTEFQKLGVAVTDEQHRFGVSQRAGLLSKGDNPHLLVMSATPIPRTLGLIIYGDLDISILDELPPGRQKTDTLLISSALRPRAYRFIREHIQKGRQAYIICPLVTENEQELASAEEYAAELMLRTFSDIPVGILHGKMKAAEKENIMRAFSGGELSLLVATTVIEVGVDVPNATIIMIENAERFGLSQLHQLRGRVGRGTEKSYCILVSDNTNPDTQRRLQTMCRTDNGFEIADEDLKQRGPGDFFGERQHGLPALSIADFADTKSLEISSQMAEFILQNRSNFSEKELKCLNSALKRLFREGGANSLN